MAHKTTKIERRCSFHLKTHSYRKVVQKRQTSLTCPSTYRRDGTISCRDGTALLGKLLFDHPSDQHGPPPIQVSQQAQRFRIKLPEAFAGSCKCTETTPIEWPNVSRVLEHISLGVVPSPTSRVPCSGLQPTKPPSHFTAANPSVEGDKFRAPLTTQIRSHQWQHGGHGQEFKSDAHPDLGRSALQRVAECAASYRNDKRTSSEQNCREVMPDHCTHGRHRKNAHVVAPEHDPQCCLHSLESLLPFGRDNALDSIPNNRTPLCLSEAITRSLDVLSIPDKLGTVKRICWQSNRICMQSNKFTCES